MPGASIFFAFRSERVFAQALKQSAPQVVNCRWTCGSHIPGFQHKNLYTLPQTKGLNCQEGIEEVLYTVYMCFLNQVGAMFVWGRGALRGLPDDRHSI